jgi:hypothetical protein
MVPRLSVAAALRRSLITLSLHHPFAAFPDRHKILKLGGLEGTPFGNYLHTILDQALEDSRSLAHDRLLTTAWSSFRRPRRRLRASRALARRSIGATPLRGR